MISTNFSNHVQWHIIEESTKDNISLHYKRIISSQEYMKNKKSYSQLSETYASSLHQLDFKIRKPFNPNGKLNEQEITLQLWHLLTLSQDVPHRLTCKNRTPTQALERQHRYLNGSALTGLLILLQDINISPMRRISKVKQEVLPRSKYQSRPLSITAARI